MSEADQIKAFVTDIEAVIDRYRAEFELTAASVIGSLEIIKLSIFHHSMTEDED